MCSNTAEEEMVEINNANAENILNLSNTFEKYAH